MRIKTLAVSFVALLLLAGLATDTQAQCAMCKTVLLGSAEGRCLSQSLNHAILLMFCAPYLVVSTFLLLFFRKRWMTAAARLARQVHVRLTGRVVTSS